MDWEDTEKRIDEIVAESSEPFDADTIGNMHDLIALARNRCPAPEVLGKGYWSTFRVTWGNLEFEVFNDRIEVYRFFDQRTDIWYEAHSRGTPFSPEFIAELPTQP